MNTVIINGSPRKKGSTSTMVKELVRKIEGNIITVETYYANISPCYDCRHCWENDNCIINDAMQELYENINEADNIVIASPIYFAELTGSLLQFASRLQFFWVAQNIRNKPALKDKLRKGYVVLSDGSEQRYENALAMSKRLLNTMGAKFQDFAYYPNTDNAETLPPLEDEKIMAKLDEIAKAINL